MIANAIATIYIRLAGVDNTFSTINEEANGGTPDERNASAAATGVPRIALVQSRKSSISSASGRLFAPATQGCICGRRHQRVADRVEHLAAA